MIKSLGEIETLPDITTFYVELSCLDRSVKKSRVCLIDKSNELNAKLQSFGIKKEDILTTSVDMNKSYTWSNNSSIFEGFRSSITLYVTVRDIDKLDEIYTELLENRSLELGGLTYSHSRLDSFKNEAYINALAKADALADKLLDKLSESKKEILKIGNVEISASMPEHDNNFKFEAEDKVQEVMANKNNSISISKGTVYISATLFVEYQIK